MSATVGLSRRDYDDLTKLARRQEKVAKTRARQRAAELLADTEAQLAAIFEANDERWRHATERLAEMTRSANEELARICLEEGVRPEFAPKFDLAWYGRGQNLEKERRAELRKVAESRVEAMVQRAHADIEQRTVEFETELLGGTLSTDAARALLEAMPKAAAELMAPLDPAELDRSLPLTDRYGRALTAGGD